jgi:FAD:protein FMN transferase
MTTTAGEPTTVRVIEPVMGTVVTIDVPLTEPEQQAELHLVLAKARALLHRVDSVFSLWKDESPMSRVRRGELDLIDAPAEIAAVLDLCEQARQMTNGWFDATVLPGGVDPTGLVKGWGAQRAKDAICTAGFADVLLNAGGDVAASGGPRPGERWRIGIRHPSDPLLLVGVVEGAPAIATSGTYERGAHLYDPREQRFSVRFGSATVIGPDLALADALATGLCVAGEEGLAFIDAAPGYEGFGIHTDGTIAKSRRFAFAEATKDDASASAS